MGSPRAPVRGALPVKPGKRITKVRTTLTRRNVDAFKPADTARIAWDDKLTGFELRRPVTTMSPGMPGTGSARSENSEIADPRSHRWQNPENYRRSPADPLLEHPSCGKFWSTCPEPALQAAITGCNIVKLISLDGSYV